MRGSASTGVPSCTSSSASVCRTMPNDVVSACASASCCHSSGTSVLVVTSRALRGRTVLRRNEGYVSSEISATALSCTSLMAATSPLIESLSFVRAARAAACSSSREASSCPRLSARARTSASSPSSLLRTASTCPTCPSLARAVSARAASTASVCACISALMLFNSLLRSCTSRFSSTTSGPPSRASLRNSQMRSKSLGPS
mmetsp:Transcript_36414/g.93012  ORF Transcript_36414/g.93012 Transcript_36414/m.93012 type:complete len:202 (-) Transcript_36414:267-872(-)